MTSNLQTTKLKEAIRLFIISDFLEQVGNASGYIPDKTYLRRNHLFMLWFYFFLLDKLRVLRDCLKFRFSCKPESTQLFYFNQNILTSNHMVLCGYFFHQFSQYDASDFHLFQPKDMLCKYSNKKFFGN